MKPILLVDDDRNSLGVVADKLISLKYDVIVANSHHGVLKRLRNIEPSLIILDLDITRINGIDFYNKISNKDGYPRYPILFITASDGLINHVANDCENVGFVEKPLRMLFLINEIERVLKCARSMETV